MAATARWASRAPGPTALGIVLACGLAGCGHGRETASPEVTLADDAITVGSFDFAESVAVAEVYSQGLEAAGYQVERAFSLGPREFVGPAMSRGLVEMVPEYAGTALLFHSLGRGSASSDPDETHARLVEALAGAPVQVLGEAPAQDANAFVVTAATAERLGLEQVSDLAAVAPELVFGGPPECPTRRLCLDGLDDVYGARFREFVALDAGGPLTHQALVDGSVDVALLFTTDPAIEALGLVELADDRHLQPAENITPIVRAELVRRHGQELVEVIDSISAELTTARVRDLNADVAAGDVAFPGQPAVAGRSLAGAARSLASGAPCGHCVPRPRRPLLAARSLALARSHRREGAPVTVRRSIPAPPPASCSAWRSRTPPPPSRPPPGAPDGDGVRRARRRRCRAASAVRAGVGSRPAWCSSRG